MNLNDVEDIQTKTFKIEMLNFGLSLICANYKG
jgi:hypothetical protein